MPGFVYPLYRIGYPFADFARCNGRRGILLKPDWSYLKPGTMLTALGRAFFAEHRRVRDDYLCFVFG